MCVESRSGSTSRRCIAKVVASESSARSTMRGPSARSASAACPPAQAVRIGDRTGSVVHHVGTKRSVPCMKFSGKPSSQFFVFARRFTKSGSAQNRSRNRKTILTTWPTSNFSIAFLFSRSGGSNRTPASAFHTPIGMVMMAAFARTVSPRAVLTSTAPRPHATSVTSLPSRSDVR